MWQCDDVMPLLKPNDRNFFFKSSKEYPLKFLELTEFERVYFFQVQNICTMHFLEYAKIFINFFAVKIQKSFFVQNFQFTFQTFSKWFSMFVFLLLEQKKLLLAGNESSSCVLVDRHMSFFPSHSNLIYARVENSGMRVRNTQRVTNVPLRFFKTFRDRMGQIIFQ